MPEQPAFEILRGDPSAAYYLPSFFAPGDRVKDERVRKYLLNRRARLHSSGIWYTVVSTFYDLPRVDRVFILLVDALAHVGPAGLPADSAGVAVRKIFLLDVLSFLYEHYNASADEYDIQRLFHYKTEELRRVVSYNVDRANWKNLLRSFADDVADVEPKTVRRAALCLHDEELEKVRVKLSADRTFNMESTRSSVQRVPDVIILAIATFVAETIEAVTETTSDILDNEFRELIQNEPFEPVARISLPAIQEDW